MNDIIRTLITPAPRLGRGLLLALVCAALLAPGCGRKSGRGMKFPPGDLQAGKQAFVDLGCAKCHSVEGADLPAPTAKPAIGFTLGGDTKILPSDGELFTAIVYPAAKLRPGADAKKVAPEGETRMADYTTAMTVRQLVDIVAWLQSKHVRLVSDLPYHPHLF